MAASDVVPRVVHLADMGSGPSYPHNVFVRTKLKDNGKTSVQIVESHRKADKVSQKIIRHVRQAVTEMEIEELRKLAQKIIVEMKNQRSPVLPIFSPEDRYGSRPCTEAIDDTVNISRAQGRAEDN